MTERLYHEIMCPSLTKAGPCDCTPVFVADDGNQQQRSDAVDPVAPRGQEGSTRDKDSSSSPALPARPEEHRHEYEQFTVCKICGKTEAAIEGCHHCVDGDSVRNGRCWWCLKPIREAASPARARLMALKKAVERYDANDSDTSYYDAKEVCDEARALLVQITVEERQEEQNLSRVDSVPGSAHGDLPRRPTGDKSA